MRQNNLSIHSENILPIIKKWLYSDKDIFIRELVSNATDALSKLRVLKQEEPFTINVTINADQKTISISDTGIGMTEEEVEKYIAQIAFSGAEEFASKYQANSEQIIGHFGLGFYSSYMVASKVEIQTLSYLPNSTPVFWSCDGTSSYTIGQGNRETRGTEIILHIDEENGEYLNEAKLRQLLDRYCKFMPFPISINGKPIGNKEPLWQKAPSECTEQEYLDCYRQLFPFDQEPLFWVHLNVDYPFNLKGILYFPKTQRRFDGEEKGITLFCNKVFVSDHCKEIFPDYLMVLRGAIDSPDIPLNVSRSYLQVDQNVKQLSVHIGKKIADKLTTFLSTEKEKYIEAWPEIELFLKLGILQDAKFYDRTKDLLIWKNSSNEWTTLADYIERNKEKKIYYATQSEGSPLLNLYKEKNIEILFASSPVDTAIIQFLEDKLSTTFQRIDGACPDELIDSAKEKTLLDADGRTEAAKIADYIRSSLDLKEVEIEAKSLASDNIPSLLIVDENQRRLRDYIALTQGKNASTIQPKKTFIVNTNNKLVLSSYKLMAKDPSLAKEMAKSLYNLSLIAQKEIKASDVDQLLAHQTEVMEKLASLIV